MELGLGLELGVGAGAINRGGGTRGSRVGATRGREKGGRRVGVRGRWWQRRISKVKAVT